MRILPFPLFFNIGTDIVHIPRIYRLITLHRAGTTKSSVTYLDRFTRRILCEQEQKDFHTKFFRLQASRSPSLTSGLPIPGETQTMARWLAGRFAAKEAARKAAPGGAASISWKDVMVRVDPEADGKPEVVYIKDGGATGEVGKLSISHDGEYVVATVLAAGSTGASPE